MPHYHDRHPDHKNANELVRDSAFYSGLDKILTSSEGQPQSAHRPKKSFYYMQTYTFEPSFIMDISEEFESKMKAVGCYASQFYAEGAEESNSHEPQTFISSKRFMDYLKARAMFYGFRIGADYGEPFFTEDNIDLKIENLF
jgi:LmbE family N-acetylglucosaminyl deacetylase